MDPVPRTSDLLKEHSSLWALTHLACRNGTFPRESEDGTPEEARSDRRNRRPFEPISEEKRRCGTDPVEAERKTCAWGAANFVFSSRFWAFSFWARVDLGVNAGLEKVTHVAREVPFLGVSNAHSRETNFSEKKATRLEAIARRFGS